MKKILEIGGEGGNIQLIELNGYFLYFSDESTLAEFANDIDPHCLKSKPKVFKTFNEAFNNLLKKYPIFKLLN